MIVTTTPTIEGHTIKEYKGLVSGEVIFGMNFLKDFGASLRDFFGGRTDSYEKAISKDARQRRKRCASAPRNWAPMPSWALALAMRRWDKPTV